MVMCSDPVMRAPARGLLSPYSWRRAIRPGISTWARLISRRPKSARLMSAALWGGEAVVVVAVPAVLAVAVESVAGGMGYSFAPVSEFGRRVGVRGLPRAGGRGARQSNG